MKVLLKHVNYMILEEPLASGRLVAVGWFQFFWGGGFEPMLKPKWTCLALISRRTWSMFFLLQLLWGNFLVMLGHGMFLICSISENLDVQVQQQSLEPFMSVF